MSLENRGDILLRYDIRERLIFAMRNETDGFMATVLEPHESGLPAYIIFNCYGIDRCILIPQKHKKMIVEIAEYKGADKSAKRFNWKETIPIEVSEAPKILLRGKKLRNALSLFNRQDWETVYSYISRNRHAIERHWTGESDSLRLLNELKR